MTRPRSLDAMKNPIVPREIRKVYEGKIFDVQIETLALPKGGEREPDGQRDDDPAQPVVALGPLRGHPPVVAAR